jgi:hypothetical protein
MIIISLIILVSTSDTILQSINPKEAEIKQSKKMRIYLLLFIACLFIASSCNKEEISGKQMATFVKYYGGNQDDEGYKVVSLDNGGYLLMGTMETPDRAKDICIIRTDKYGNSVAPVKLYGNSYNDFGYAIKKNSRGFVIAGSTVTKSSNGKKDILLIQIDENGNEIKKSTFGTSLNEEATDFIVESNNNIVLTGYTDSTETLTKDLILIKTDSSFKVIGHINQVFHAGDDEGKSITATGKEGVYLLAGYASKIGAVGESEILIVKWTGVGVPSPYFLNKDVNAKAINILPLANENYLLTCNIDTSGAKPNLFKVIKIAFNNNSLSTVWNRTYGEKKINRATTCRMLDDKIYILGTAGANEDYGDMFMLVLDNNGNKIQYNYIGDGLSFTGRGFDFTSDGFIITGANNQNKFSLITLIKVNNNFSF